MISGMNQSRFSMWRAVVAMVHADGVVTPHEVSFVNKQVKDLNFSEAQLKTLSEDFLKPQQVAGMFGSITAIEDKKDFFALARALSWSDGDMCRQEQHIIEILEAAHMNDKDRHLLQESRQAMYEIEMADNTWVYKTDHGRSMFGFLKELMAA